MKKVSLIKIAFALSFLFFSIAPLEAHDTLKAYVGIWYQHIDKDKSAFMEVPNKNTNGILINGIADNSPASSAGLEPMDYVYAIDGNPFDDSRNWFDEVKQYDPGKSFTLSVVRQTEQIELIITLAEKSTKTDDEYDTGAFLGVNYRWNQNKQPKSGALVDVIDGTSAEDMGLENGDVITEVNGIRIYDFHDLGIVVDNTPVGNEFCVTYLRNGSEAKTCGPIGTHKDDSDILEDMIAEVNEELEEWVTAIDEAEAQLESLNREEDDENEMTRSFQSEDADVWIGDMNDQETEMMEEVYSMEMPDRGIPFREINLFPNPNRGQFTFFIDLETRGDAELLVTDSNGKQVYKENIPAAEGRIERNLDVSTNAKGVYFLVIIQNNKSITKRVIVN